MNIYRIALALLATLISSEWAAAQCSEFTDKLCQNINFICNVEDLYGNRCMLADPDTYNPDNDPNIPDEIPNCTNEGNAFRLQNPHWYSFIAVNRSARIRMRLFTCSGSQAPGEDGIQYALIEDCETMEIFECQSGSTSGGFPFSDFNIDYFNLSVGKTYFFVIDGFAASVCTYEFRSISGFGNFVLEDISSVKFDSFPNDTVCAGLDSTIISLDPNPGENLNDAEITHWEVYHLPDRDNPVLDTIVSGISFEYEFLAGGDYELFVQASNSCLATNNYRHAFFVEEIEEMVMDTFRFCLEDLSDGIPDYPEDPRYAGEPITSIAVNPFIDTIYNGAGCPLIQIVPLDPVMPSLRQPVTQYFCNEDSVVYNDLVYHSSVIDSLMALDNQSQAGCDSLILLNLILFKIDGYISVVNCEENVSEIAFIPYQLEPAGNLDSVQYFWTDQAGNLLAGTHEEAFVYNQTDSIFLEVIAHRQGETCVAAFSAFAEPIERSLSVSCIQASPGSLTIEWNDIPGMESYGVLLDGDTLQLGVDTSFTMTGLNPGSSVALEVVAISENDCPELFDTITCQVEDCNPDISLEISPGDTQICLGEGTEFIDYSYILTGDNGTGQIIWQGDGSFDPATGRFDALASGPGEYRVVLQYEDGPCIYSDTSHILIERMPNAMFQVQDSVCENTEVTIHLNDPIEQGWLHVLTVDSDHVLNQINDSTFIIEWENPGFYELHLEVSNEACTSSTYTAFVTVDVSPGEPLIQCLPREDLIEFVWNQVYCASGYELIINDTIHEFWNDTSYVVNNLSLGDSVKFSVLPITDCFCPAGSTEVTCFTQACPVADFSLVSMLCESDTAMVTLAETIQNGYSVDFEIEGVHILEPVGLQQYRIHWFEPGIYEVQLRIDNGTCVSEVYSQLIEITPELEPLNLICRPDLDRIEVQWQSIECASQFNVYSEGQLVATVDDTSYVFDGLSEGDMINISIEPVSDCPCQGSPIEISCQARACEPILVKIAEIGDYCLPPGSEDSIRLQIDILNSMGTGSGSWLGMHVDTAGIFYASEAGAGVHEIQYWFDEEGCQYSDTIFISVYQTPELDIFASSPVCPNQILGNIEIIASGGSGNYIYLINGVEVEDPVSNPSGPGIYDVEVIDDNQCIVTALGIEITASPEEQIQIFGSFEANEGDSLSHSISSSIPESEILEYAWYFNGNPLCGSGSCMGSIEWMPQSAGEVCTEIRYGDDCILTTCRGLQYYRVFNVYFPNVFRPHGGNLANSHFWIYSNDPNAFVEDLQIFDRWGNLMYSVSQAAMEGDSIGWDGTFQGEYVRPGVYVFKANLRFQDGTTDQIAGSVTLVH